MPRDRKTLREIQAFQISYDSALKDLTTSEVAQLGNINLTTISTSQWGFLGAMSALGGAFIALATAVLQRAALGLGTTDSVTFSSLTISTLTLSNPLPYNTKRITNSNSPYTVLSTDEIIVCDTDTGAVEVDLPVATNGRHLKIINSGSSNNNVTVDPNGTEQLFGAGGGVASTLADGENIDIHGNTTNGWW